MIIYRYLCFVIMKFLVNKVESKGNFKIELYLMLKSEM